MRASFTHDLILAQLHESARLELFVVVKNGAAADGQEV